MLVLGIETSCDETAVALVTSDKEIIAQQILSQQEHQAYGGVVPELSSRSHIKYLNTLISSTLIAGNTTISQIDAIAVTAGPGLIGGVLVGVMIAKGMAAAANKPFIAVNHLEGHALSARLSNDVPFPFLLLLISGGHCQLLQVDGVGKYILYGQTMDDAIGESFDKVARMLGLSYPGGPLVEKLALTGNAKRFSFPRPMFGRIDNCDFSLSGLKTAVKRTVDSMPSLNEQDVSDICASFQHAVAQVIVDRLEIAITRFKINTASNRLVIAGGVAANKFLFGQMKTVADKHKFEITAPPLDLCTDNAAMIAWAGIEKMHLGQQDELSFEPRSRWPLC